jgi:RNA polymerase sigma-70 factor (ECF subfamily)
MFQKRLTKKSDEELMLLIQQGEERALSELYKRYSKPMVRYFYRMLWKDEEKAQDFLHDIFLKIIDDPKKFNTEKRFSTWFYSVAHNMCKNEYRKQNFRNNAHEQMLQTSVFEINVHERIDEKDFAKALDTAIAQWKDEDKSLFILRLETALTFGEIAAILNCPEGTVKSRWFYLRKELSIQFQEYHPVLK